VLQQVWDAELRQRADGPGDIQASEKLKHLNVRRGSLRMDRRCRHLFVFPRKF
jgi:hypothetical protein